MNRGAWQAAVYGVAQGRTRLSDFSFTFHFSCIGEGNDNPLQCSCLENPRKGGAYIYIYIHTHTHTYICVYICMQTLIKSTTERQTTKLENGQKIEQTFLQRRYAASQQAHERCSISLAIREMQVKTTKRITFHIHQDGQNQKDR